MSNDSSEEKKHQATDVKLNKERDKGRIAKSADLYSATAALTGFVSLSLLAGYLLHHISNIFDASTRAISFQWEAAINFSVNVLVNEFALIILPVFGAVVFAVIISNLVYNKGVPFSFDPVKPQFNRLNPVQGFKNIFGKKGMISAAQMLVRLLLWAGGFFIILWMARSELLNLPLCGISCISPIGKDLAIRLISYSCLILFLVALFDMPIQKAMFLMDQKMGHSEKKREDKDVYGSPEIKSARREFQRELSSTASGPQKIQQATIIILGESSAIAVYYDTDSEKGPSVITSSKGDDTKKIIEKAHQENIPIHKDDELAQGLISTPGGTVIQPKHYTRLATAMVKCGIVL